MKICELVLNNFGKFSNKKIVLTEGIQLLYGENESGKSTLHTFIKGMLFGIERGRGRAANSDVFSRYEPWENPNYYSGRLTIEVGEKHFIIERNFDKYAKKVQIVCQEDGEALSAEDGDLDMLLDGLTASGYENTVSIGQLKAQPGSSLSAELKNYATNYYVAGDSDLNVEAALKKLQDDRKEAERCIREITRKKQEKRDRVEQELSYIWRDIHRITEEQELLEEEIANRKERMEQREKETSEVKQRMLDELRPPKWRVHPVEIIVFIAALIVSFLFIPKPWNSFITVVMFLCGLIYIWNRMKIAKKQVKTEPELILEEITPEEEKIPYEKLIWEYEHHAGELKEKQVQYENLKEMLEELDEVSDERIKYKRKSGALQLAAERIEELSDIFRKKLKGSLNADASEIICEITGGKYSRLILEEEPGQGLVLGLLSDGRRISSGQVSRGTLEQVYFALRMAAGRLLYKEDYPIVLDDTFVCYDDERMARTLKWLHENKKQVLIFTCQRREEETLKKLKIPYRKVDIF